MSLNVSRMTPSPSFRDVASNVTVKAANKAEVASAVSEIKQTGTISREQFQTLSKGIEGGDKAIGQLLKTIMPEKDIAQLRDFSVSKLFTSNNDIKVSIDSTKLSSVKEGFDKIMEKTKDTPLLVLPSQPESTPPTTSPSSPKVEASSAPTSPIVVTKQISLVADALKIPQKIVLMSKSGSEIDLGKFKKALKENENAGYQLSSVNSSSPAFIASKTSVIKNKIEILGEMIKQHPDQISKYSKEIKSIIKEVKGDKDLTKSLQPHVNKLKEAMNKDPELETDEKEDDELDVAPNIAQKASVPFDDDLL